MVSESVGKVPMEVGNVVPSLLILVVGVAYPTAIMILSIYVPCTPTPRPSTPSDITTETWRMSICRRPHSGQG